MPHNAADAVRVGLVQMCTGRNVEKNLHDASALVRDAACGDRADVRFAHADHGEARWGGGLVEAGERALDPL